MEKNSLIVSCLLVLHFVCMLEMYCRTSPVKFVLNFLMLLWFQRNAPISMAVPTGLAILLATILL